MNTRHLFRLILVVSLYTMGVRKTIDPDLWWHLETGKYITQHGIPTSDPFSFTFLGKPWVTHEWLSELLMWWLYDWGGLTALILFFALLTMGTYLLLERVCAGRPFLSTFVVLLSAIASAIVWGARPQMFNLFFAALFVLILERERYEGWERPWVLWLLVPLTAVWANLHSGYLLGIVIIGTYAGGWGLQNLLVTKDALKRPLRMAGVGVASFLAAALNPNGIALWWYPFETLSSPSMRAFILEWHSPDFHNAIFWPFALMVGVGVLAFIFSGKKPTWDEALLFFGTVVGGLSSARNIPIFAIVATPIVSRHLLWASQNTRFYALLNGDTPPPPTTLITTILNMVVSLTILFGAFIWTGNTIIENEEVLPEMYPVTAVDYLIESGLAEQNGYNLYNWGGYLIWRGVPVFVDGRADVYGDEFLFFYRQAFDILPNWADPLEAHEVQYVLMERGSGLGVILQENEGWQLDYTDDVAEIFVRQKQE